MDFATLVAVKAYVLKQVDSRRAFPKPHANSITNKGQEVDDDQTMDMEVQRFLNQMRYDVSGAI